MRGPLSLLFNYCKELTFPKPAEAITTVDGTSVTGLERDFAVLPALSTYRRIHLPILETVAAVGSRNPTVSTAGETTLGFVCITLGREELLLLGREYEVRTAVNTLQRLVCETHWMTSFC